MDMGYGRFLSRDGTAGVLNDFYRSRSLSVSHALHPAYIDISDRYRTLLVTSTRYALHGIFSTLSPAEFLRSPARQLAPASTDHDLRLRLREPPPAATLLCH